jgi:hypothetical protein
VGSRNLRRASCSGALMGQRGIPPTPSRPAKLMLGRRHVGLARNKGLQLLRARILNPVKSTTTYSIRLSASAGGATAPGRLASQGFAERNVMERAAGSLRLDVRSPDHLAPLFGFVGDVSAELGGRECEWNVPQVGKARLQLGIHKTSVDLPV